MVECETRGPNDYFVGRINERPAGKVASLGAHQSTRKQGFLGRFDLSGCWVKFWESIGIISGSAGSFR